MKKVNKTNYAGDRFNQICNLLHKVLITYLNYKSLYLKYIL